MTKRYQLVGIGNAIVDVLCHIEDPFLDEMGVEKGIMQLIDTGRATELYNHMGPSTEISGGSAANTIAGFAALGGRTAYVGKVKDDQLGAIFAHDIRAQGAGFETPLAPRSHEAETGRCMVLVTPDGERLVDRVGNVLDRLAQVEDAVEHQLKLAPFGPHDQVVALRSPAERLGHHRVDHQHGHLHNFPDQCGLSHLRKYRLLGQLI